MAPSGFWTAKPTVDPARQFRFQITINDTAGNPVVAWWPKTCDRPKINIPVLAKDEYYLGSALPDTKPGEIVDFQPITMTFIDPIEPSIGASIVKQLSEASGEFFPRINGAELKKAFGEVGISQIDARGVLIETFVLKGAFPTSIDFGSLDYGSDDFVEITMTWEYTSFDYFKNGGNTLLSKAPESMKDAKRLDGSYT